MAIFTLRMVAHSAYQLAPIATKSTFMMTTALTVERDSNSMKKKPSVFRANKGSFTVSKKIMMMMILANAGMKDVSGCKMER